MADTDDVLSTEIHPAGYAVLTLNRPQAMNALNKALMRALADAIDDLGTNPAVRVLILTGAGKAFCAGLDLKEIGSGQGSLGGSDGRPSGDPVAAIGRYPGPVIGAINGASVTGGFELALACDLRVAAAEARIGLPEAGLGLLPGAGGTQRLTQLCGPGVAKRLILGAEVLDGRQAEQLGLVQWALPRAELAALAQALAERLAARPRAALAAAKACIDAALDAARDGYAEELRATRALYEHPPTRRLVADFLARSAG